MSMTKLPYLLTSRPSPWYIFPPFFIHQTQGELRKEVRGKKKFFKEKGKNKKESIDLTGKGITTSLSYDASLVSIITEEFQKALFAQEIDLHG
jgi:hypothetical protein